jgi:hypothetical protein
VAADIADLLVQRMIAERISRKLIRMMPPNSVFGAAAKIALPQIQFRYVPEKLPPAEVEGAYFQQPESAKTSLTTVPRMHCLPRFREVFGDNQMVASL